MTRPSVAALAALSSLALLGGCDSPSASSAPAAPSGSSVLAGRVLRSETEGASGVAVRAVDTATGRVVAEAVTDADGAFRIPVDDCHRGWVLAASRGQDSGSVRVYQPGKPVVLDLAALQLDTIALPLWKDWKVVSVKTEGLESTGRLLGDTAWVVRLPEGGDVRLVVELQGPDGLAMTVRVSLRRTAERTIPVVPVAAPERTPGLRARWTFDAWKGLQLPSEVAGSPALVATKATALVAGASGQALVPSAGAHPSTPDAALFSAGKGGLTLLARVYLDAYPSDALHNGRAVVAGQYDGFRILVTNDGRIQVAGQRGTDGSWSWYAPQSRPGVVPLGRWVELGLGADPKTAELVGYVDGEPVQLFSGIAVEGDSLRDGTGSFMVGADAFDGQEFPGRIDEVSLLDGLPLGQGPAVRIGSGSNLFFPVVPTEIAHWGFDFWSNGRIIDETGHGHDLVGDKSGLVTSPNGMAWDGTVSSRLLGGLVPELGVVAGAKVRYEARVKLSALPSSSLHNGRSVLMGFYAGPKILVTDKGALQIGGQRGNGSSWSWYAPQSADGVVPVGQWVTVAMEADPATASFRAWVDGKEIALASGVDVPGTLLRPAYGEFTVGADAVDGQDFPGQIEEARVLRVP